VVLSYDLPDPVESGEEAIANLEEAVDLLKSVVRELRALTEFLAAFYRVREIVIIHDGVVTNQAKVKTIVRILGDLLTSEFAPLGGRGRSAEKCCA